MSESTWEIPWPIMSQVRSEIESEIRSKISKDIHEYSAMCQERGISTYFTSGLEVAAGIAVRGIPKPEREEQTEVLL